MRTSIFACSAGGSSPLTRGKLVGLLGRRLRGRLIPAHAGKTLRPTSRGALAWAHPRSRGENFSHVIRMSPSAGSSPLTRGKQPRRPRCRPRDRLIPAHAGKTSSFRYADLSVPAHPRSRGENAATSGATTSVFGSSPLTRGKQLSDARRRGYRRLIPAHAGKTGLRARSPRRRRAHPRSRGENQVHAIRQQITAGSSPLTRGKRW